MTRYLKISGAYFFEVDDTWMDTPLTVLAAIKIQEIVS